jgi:hypothetical protein
MTVRPAERGRMRTGRWIRRGEIARAQNALAGGGHHCLRPVGTHQNMVCPSWTFELKLTSVDFVFFVGVSLPRTEASC